MKCDCYSSNGSFGTTPNVEIDPNKYFDFTIKSKPVLVDACIKNEITALWLAGIWTRGSCCGHNGVYGKNPNVIIANHEDGKKAQKILKEVDSKRNWDILQWQLINTVNNKRFF